ncbi:MAG: IMP dehydrogenase [bacterium]
MDGVSIKELFELNKGVSLAYNDIILLPGYTDFSISDADLSTKLSRNITLKIPIISAPMDTVTGDEMAKWMALLGGIGFIHYNQTIEEQCEMVKKVKKFENGFISEPEARSPDDLIESLKESPYSNIPITEDGSSHGKLVGILNRYDYSYEKHLKLPVKERMAGLDKLKIASEDEILENNCLSIKKADHILIESHSLVLPIVDKNGFLKYLVTRKDIDKNTNFPLATKDKNKKLRAGAAVGTQEDDKKRVNLLAASGVDVIKIDSAHGHTLYQIEMIKYIKKNYPEIDIITGNIVTSSAAKDLISAGADALCIGMGIGSICTTQEVTAAGRAQASAIYNIAMAAKKYNIPVIADGGISKSGQIVRAMVLGASSCMAGNLLAGTNESLGEWIINENGEKFKRYRGMGSYEAMKTGSAKRYAVDMNKEKAAEGVVAAVASKGHIYDLLPSVAAGVKQGLQKIGCKNMEEIKKASDNGEIRVELRSFSAQKEGDVHDVIMGK